MSGIAGIIRFDGQEVHPDDISGMAELLNHRGKPGTQRVEGGILMAFGGSVEVGEAAALYAVADADVFDPLAGSQPFTNRYAHRGPVSFDELNADFSVAVWDIGQQSLCCARDILGVKPLYYVHQPGRLFAFASEIKALTALREVPVQANRHKFIEYLTWPTTYVPYSAETFYENIYSLLPGHYLRVSHQETQVLPYWKIDLSKYSTLSSPEDYATLFRDSFTAAVSARMKGKDTVGAHLSGGLDSSSVSCVAQTLLTQQERPRLHTFNIDTQLASTDESIYVQSVLDRHEPRHHALHPVADVLESVLKINYLFDRPEHFIIPSSFHLSVAGEARELGCSIVLTGHDGDSVVTTGFEYIDQLIEESDWESLKLACQEFMAHPNRPLPFGSEAASGSGGQARINKYTLHILGSEITKRFRAQPLGTFMKTLYTQKKLFGISTTSIAAYCLGRIRHKLSQKKLVDTVLRADFRPQVPHRAPGATKEFTDRLASRQHLVLDQVLNTANVICNEQLNHIGAYYGHQYSFPFFDRQVIEVGLATPLWVRFDQGRGRGLIRNGLQTVLPEAIVSRLTKANFVEYGTLSAQQLYQATHEQFAEPGHAIWEVVDQKKWMEIVAVVFDSQIPVVKKARYNWLLSRIIYLALWLGSLKTSQPLYTQAGKSRA